MQFKKYLAIFITLLGLSYFTTQEAWANSNEELISQVKVYDGEDNLIPYTTEELKEMFKFETDNILSRNKNLVAPFALQRTYNTGAFSFLNYIFINSGGSFKNPIDIQITPKGEAKEFDLTISSTTTGGKVQTVNFPSGWIGTVHWSLRGFPDDNYKFKFTNKHYSKNYMDNVSIIYTY